jgi:two-component system response regulator
MMNTASLVDILLVEDNPADAELALHSLKKSKLANNIEWVKDGEEALEFLFQHGRYEGRKSGNPRVVLLDLRLPKVDGFEVLRALRSEDSTREIPVVVLTSSKEDKDLVEAYGLGVNSFVRKPISFDEFSKTVADLGMYWLLVNQIPDPSTKK